MFKKIGFGEIKTIIDDSESEPEENINKKESEKELSSAERQAKAMREAAKLSN